MLRSRMFLAPRFELHRFIARSACHHHHAVRAGPPESLSLLLLSYKRKIIRHFLIEDSEHSPDTFTFNQRKRYRRFIMPY